MQAALPSGSLSSGSVTWVPRLGRDPRHLGLVVDLLGADPVGPDAGRVDHVRRPGSRSVSPLSASAQTTPVGAAVRSQQAVTSAPFSASRRRSARPRRGSSARGGRRRSGSRRRDRPPLGSRRLQRRDELDRLLAGDRPVAVRRPGLGEACRLRSRSRSRRRASLARPWPTRVVAMTSYMLRPMPILKSRRSSPSVGTR